MRTGVVAAVVTWTLASGLCAGSRAAAQSVPVPAQWMLFSGSAPSAGAGPGYEVAQPIEPVRVDEVREPTDPPPTYFIVEGYGGATLVGGFGGYGSLLLGAGGKPVGFPLRFYLVGEVAYSTAASDGVEPGLGVGYGELRGWFDLAAGLRVVAPLVEPLRVHFDVLGGGSYGSSSLDRDGFRWTSDPLSDLRESLGIATFLPVTLSAGLTWHL